MNPRRWRVAFRWCLGLAPLLTAAAWLLGEVWGLYPRAAGLPFLPSPTRPAPTAQERAPEQERLAASLQAALRALEAAPAPLSPPDMRLLAGTGGLPPEQSGAPDARGRPDDPKPSPRLSLIFLSRKGRLAIIDNGIYAESGRLPDGRVVERIERDGVLLRNGERRDWLAWTPIQRVELRRAQDPHSEDSVNPPTTEDSTRQAGGGLAPKSALRFAPDMGLALRFDNNVSSRPVPRQEQPREKRHEAEKE